MKVDMRQITSQARIIQVAFRIVKEESANTITNSLEPQLFILTAK